MSVRRLLVGALPALCALVGGFVFLCGSASAAITHNLLSRITEVPVSSGASVSGPLGNPWGLTIDSGSLFVADPNKAVVDEFDAAGEFVAQITGTGGSYSRTIAVNAASGEVYVADSGPVIVHAFDSTGAFLQDWTGSDTPAGSFGGSYVYVAADSSTSLTDPAAGYVYVADSTHGVVDVFKPLAGGKEEYLTQIAGTPGGPFVNLSGVAIDQATGDVYVTDASSGGAVDVFRPTALGQYEYLRRLTLPLGRSFGEIGGVAIDPVDGDVYISDSRAGAVDEFDSTGAHLGQITATSEGPLREPFGIAVDASEKVYVAEGSGGVVNVFGPNVVVPDVSTSPATGVATTTAVLNGSVNADGTSVTACEFEYGDAEGAYEQTIPCSQSLPISGESPAGVSAEVTGLTIGSPYRYRVVATNANGTSVGNPVEFETRSTAPGVESESAENIGSTVATLGARINQHKAATAYHFEYGPDGNYGTSIPVPDKSIGSAPNETTVSQVITGLTVGATYHYRVVATNADGTTNGPDQTLETFPITPSGETESCPNAASRLGISKGLPDCRAYEMVSPLDKNGSDVFGQDDTSMASPGGEEIAYLSLDGFSNTAGSGGGGLVQYVAFRGTNAWSTYAITPTPATSAFQIFGGDTFNRLFSSDFTGTVVEGYVLPDAEAGVPTAQNLYLEDVKSQQLDTITKPEEGTESNDPIALENSLRGASSDLGVIVFQSSANILTEATGSAPKLYVWDHGTLQLAGILPDGTIPAGGSTSARGSGEEAAVHHDAVSTDGSRTFFMSPTDGSSAPQLYMRENEERTIWVSQSEASTPNPEPQSIKFQGATPDGNKVLFSTTDRLLDIDPGGPGYALYRYVNSQSPEIESNLTFVGRFTGRDAPTVVGMSTDAKKVYFTTWEENFIPDVGGVFPLKLWDEGVTRVVSEFPGGGSSEEGSEPVVSSNGDRIAFLAGEPSPNRHQMYLYDAPSETLKCVSCRTKNTGTTLGVDANPHATEYGHGIGLRFPHQLMSEDGRYVFFATPDALLPQDTNGLADVYEYDADAGKLALLSSGAGDEGAWFMDASASGRDVFFVSQHSYSRSDTDSLVDLYDARVDGGLPEPPPPPVPCAGDACQGIPSAAPSFTTSSGFSGLGNVAVKPMASHKKKSKPKAKKKRPHSKTKHRGKKSKRSNGRRHATTRRVGR